MPLSSNNSEFLPATKIDSRDNNLNFLRLLFASLVLVSHAPELHDGNRSHELLTQLFGSISFGDLAVEGFFLLSGLLIVSSWERRPELRDFFEKRIRRIVPGFLMAFLVSVFLVAPFAVRDVATYFTTLNYKSVLALALQLRPPEAPAAFIGRPQHYLNGALWSIAYEFRCYAIVAVIGLLGAKRQKSVWLTLFIVSLGLLLLPQQVRQVSFPGSYRLIDNPVEFVRVFTFFCAGACFHLFRNSLVLRGPWAAAATAVVFVLMFSPAVANVALATAGAYALFWFAFARIPALGRFKHLDDVSYGLYLYGWPTGKLLDWYFPNISPWLLLPVALVVCAVAGYASWHLVESPFLRRSRRTN